MHKHHHTHASAYAGDACGCGEPHHHCCEPPFEAHGKGCGGDTAGHGFHRRFRTRDERLAELEAYLADLRAEAQAVEEKIAELRS